MADYYPVPRISYTTDQAPLDAYFALNAAGPEHRRRIALAVWDELTPADRLELQQTVRTLSGTDLKLAQTMAESMLLLRSV